MTEIGQDVYEVADAIPHLRAIDIDQFKQPVHQTARKRRRLCTHLNLSDRLHEMFVAYVKDTYVHANKHLGKDESLHILEGRADFVFFDDEGEIIDVVPLGAYGSDRAFYCRIPQGVFHTWIIHSEVIVVHESTPGPFERKDTVFATWAPPEGDVAVGTYMSNLAQRANEFLSRQLSALERPTEVGR